MKRKLLTVFPDHLSSVAHLVRLGRSADVSFYALACKIQFLFVLISETRQEQISKNFLIDVIVHLWQTAGAAGGATASLIRVPTEVSDFLFYSWAVSIST
jgi:hypothetical protein